MRWTIGGLLLLAGCQTVSGGMSSPAALVTAPALSLLVENDSIGIGDTTDKGYTNGLELEWTPPLTDSSGTWARTLRSLPLLPEGADAPHASFFLGQRMFTPERIRETELISDDRPYAGWLYGGVAARNVQLGPKGPAGDRLDEWRLTLGVVGPSSYADDVQVEWHQIIDSPTPRGWAHQLHDEPGGILSYRRVLRSHARSFGDGLQGDVLFEVRARAGNVHTDAGLGTTVRLGSSLPRDFGTPARLVDRGADTLRPRPVPVSVYGLAGLRGDWVVHDIFLDGNTDGDSHSVDRNPFVADFFAGIEVRLSHRVRLSYRHVFRTAEFESDVTTGDLQDFASVQLLVTF